MRPQPKIILKVEGSLREIRAELRAKYADGMWEGPLARDSDNVIGTPRFLRHSKDSAILLRDTDAERAALTRMEARG